MKLSIHRTYKVSNKVTGVVYSIDGVKCATFVPAWYAKQGGRLNSYLRKQLQQATSTTRKAIVRMPRDQRGFRKALKEVKRLGGQYYPGYKQWVVEVYADIDWSREDMILVSWLADHMLPLYLEFGMDAPVSLAG